MQYKYLLTNGYIHYYCLRMCLKIGSGPYVEKDDDIIGMISQLSLKVRVNPSIRTSDNLGSDYMYDIHKCLQLN